MRLRRCRIAWDLRLRCRLWWGNFDETDMINRERYRKEWGELRERRMTTEQSSRGLKMFSVDNSTERRARAGNEKDIGVPLEDSCIDTQLHTSAGSL